MSYPYHRTTSAEYDDKEGGLTLETISSLLSRLEAGMLVVTGMLFGSFFRHFAYFY